MYPKTQCRIVVALAVALGTNVSADDNIIDAHITAVGGTEALAKIKTMERKGKFEVDGEFGQLAGTRREAIVNGKKAYIFADLGTFKKKSVWNGETGWIRTPQQGLRKMEAFDRETLNMAAGIDQIAAIKNQRGQDAFRLAGDQELDGKTYDVVKVVDSQLTELTFFLEKNTKLIAAMTTKRNGIVVKTTYDDYRVVAGVQLPHKTVTDMADGRATATITYTETTVNQPLDDDLFEQPTE